MSDTSKVVTLLSGGMDSTTLLYRLRSERAEVYAISFYYGQRHRRELDFASKLTHKLRIPHRIVEINSIANLWNKSALLGGADVPDGLYDAKSMSVTVVPNRNMVLASAAAGWAMTLGADEIAMAVHAGDHAIYPDCRPEFFEALNGALDLASEGNMHVYTPFIQMTKSEIVEEGETYKVPWAETWSCYKGGAKHCGRCGTCTERIESFILAGVEDPTDYDIAGKLWALNELRAAGKIPE